MAEAVRNSISRNATLPLSFSEDLALSAGQRSLTLILSAILVLSSPFWIWALFFSGNYEFGSSLIAVPVICLINLLVIVRVSRGTPALGKLMLLSYMMKIASAGGYMALLFIYYVKGADASTYFAIGKQWAAYFSVHGSFPLVGHLWGTSFINLCAAILVSIFGAAFPTINILFASVAFWGTYFFYLTFCHVTPDRPKEMGALLLFLLPSSQFWNAALGKDALMIFSIGMASYGFVLLLSAHLIKGFSFLVPAMAVGALTRPHVIGMLAISMLFPYVFSKQRGGAISRFAKLIGIPVMTAGVVYLVRHATELLNVDSPLGGLERIERLGAGTMHGGSSFGAGESTLVKILLSPFLMFRPFPWEIPNLLGVATTAEALMLLVLLWKSRRPILLFIRNWRTNSFFTYCFVFGAIFSVVFSLALSNFGLLLRQRTQYTPLLLILIACAWPLRRVRVALTS